MGEAPSTFQAREIATTAGAAAASWARRPASRQADGTVPGSLLRWPHLAALAAILLLFLAVNGAIATIPALWVDESFSIHHSRKPPSALWGEFWAHDPTPPLYYSLLWLWMQVFPETEFSARMLSLLLAGAAVVLVFRCAALLGTPRSAVFAAAAFAASPLLDEYAIEIRAYALQVVFIAAALAGTAAMTRLGGEAIRRRRDVPYLAGIAVAVALSIYTHATSVVFAAALYGATLLWAWLATRSAAFLARILAAGLLVLLASIPEIVQSARVVQEHRYSLDWLPEVELKSLLWVLRAMFVGQHTLSLMIINLLACILFLAFAWLCIVSRPTRALVCFGVALPVLGLVLTVAVSLKQPILLPRTLLWACIPMAVMVGVGLDRLAGGRDRLTLASVAAIAAAVIAIPLVANAARMQDRRWFDVLETIGRGGDQTLYAAFDPEVMCIVDFYRRAANPAPARFVLESANERWRLQQPVDTGCNRNLPVLSPAAFGRAVAASGAPVWVLLTGDRQLEDLSRTLAAMPHARAARQIVARTGVMAVKLEAGAGGARP
jgi:hypothetical protein